MICWKNIRWSNCFGNVRCAVTYVPALQEVTARRWRTPWHAEKDFLKVLDSVAASTDPYQVFVIITGGEPLMREGFGGVEKAIYDKGFPWGWWPTDFIWRERFVVYWHQDYIRQRDQPWRFTADHNWMRKSTELWTSGGRAAKMMAEEPDCVWCGDLCQSTSIARVWRWRNFCWVWGNAGGFFTVFPVGRCGKRSGTVNCRTGIFAGDGFIKRTRRRKDKDGLWLKVSSKRRGDVRDHFFIVRRRVSVGSVLVDGAISALSQHPCRLSSRQYL